MPHEREGVRPFKENDMNKKLREEPNPKGGKKKKKGKKGAY
jgi:hypothetical protein